MFRRFGTLCSTYEDGTECSETSAHKIQTTGNHQIQHSEHGESLKSRMNFITSICESVQGIPLLSAERAYSVHDIRL